MLPLAAAERRTIVSPDDGFCLIYSRTFSASDPLVTSATNWAIASK